MRPLHKVFFALDGMDVRRAEYFLTLPQCPIKKVKIGMEYFYRYGPDGVKKIHDTYGVDIFLDLKLHDIPTTVSRAIESLAKLPVSFLTIHLSCGRQALLRAVETAPQHMTLLGVGHLTSLDAPDLQKIWEVDLAGVEQSFENMFKLGLEAGLEGMVLSGRELPLLKRLEEAYKTKVVKVCPGIRFPDEIAEGKAQDQKRVLTPARAFEGGADYLVVGRSLSCAQDFFGRAAELMAY